MSLAAAFTGLQIDYIDGVTDVDERTLPPGGKDLNLNVGSLRAWRAHLNVIRRLVFSLIPWAPFHTRLFAKAVVAFSSPHVLL